MNVNKLALTAGSECQKLASDWFGGTDRICAGRLGETAVSDCSLESELSEGVHVTETVDEFAKNAGVPHNSTDSTLTAEAIAEADTADVATHPQSPSNCSVVTPILAWSAVAANRNFLVTLVRGDNWGRSIAELLRADPFCFLEFCLGLLTIAFAFKFLLMILLSLRASISRRFGIAAILFKPIKSVLHPRENRSLRPAKISHPQLSSGMH
jgi:hypothetical protein